MTTQNLIAVEDSESTRIDKYLSDHVADLTRSYAQKIINDGLVKVNNAIIKQNYKVKLNDMISYEIPEPQVLEVKAEDIKLDIVYEDKDLLVVNKPQNMVVHPAAGNYTGTLVNALMQHCGNNLSAINGVIRPGIVHRIDKDTSGLLLVAKNNKAHVGLAKQIKDHTLTRRYITIVHGVIKNDRGLIDAPIGRHPVDRKKMSVNTQNGRNAVTHFKVLEIFHQYTYIECQLETGRTHQIRVHMSYIGHPIVGDPVYGCKKEKFKLAGQALHAKLLGFIHPISGEYMEFEAPAPAYFDNILNLLRKNIMK
ncbi:RluA family pseudouridine synthase [Petroclostridium sp. X23]|uniref:RluA family pseudouridine synthase n=1 Tax=Petroclostridium sp. X23 TaxID=3045146 RepID=UPI0024ADAA34|nr:RluA family pseudouridine synthase [Petroclostridium sp. X23]WHH59542.1 RluA family pseudouridine synthase [Petroclostridium sp. X23]